jgi:hypothetical protein
MNRTLKIQEEIKKVDFLIDTARRMLAEGLMADFTSITEKVKSICSQIKNMEIEKSRKLRPSLEGVVFKMDNLADELTVSFSNGFPETHSQIQNKEQGYGSYNVFE